MLTSSSSNVASSLIADRWAQEEFNALGFVAANLLCLMLQALQH
jgi:hypothetical protein